MTVYISIDGDNIGAKIAAAYIENDEEKLSRINRDLGLILTQMTDYLRSLDLEIIFSAADGVVCKGLNVDFDVLVSYIANVGIPYFTFSAGVGNDLQSAFFALKYAKSIGKNRVVVNIEGVGLKVMGVHA